MQNEQICIVTQDLHKQPCTCDLQGSVIWRSLEHLKGHVLVRNIAPENIMQLSIRFEGYSRVWLRETDGIGKLKLSKSSYKFLHQSQELSDIQRVEGPFSGVTESVADFFFVIPRWALATGSDVPSQCLSLPPSLCVGEIVSQQSESYAQPRISYHLNVIARCLSEDVSQPKLYQSFKEITVIPYTESMPPIDTRDFPSEFIESSSKLFRKSHFGGPTYLMKLSMNEPPAIRLHNTQLAGITDAEIAVEITATGEKLKDSALKQLPDLLRELTFHVAPICRAKTFYSTTPFRKLPGQTMLHFRSNLRLHDEKSRLRTSHVTTTSWQHQNQDAESSHGAVSVSGPGSPLLLDNGPRKWNTRIHLPVEIPPGLLPTFCSAIVARQYSLIIQVTVTGANVGQFILEVPLQVTYGPLSSAESGMTAEDGFEWYNPGTSSTSASPLTIHELLGQDNTPDEDLPSYT